MLRVLVVWPFYADYVKAFYEARPGLAAADHATQLEALLDDCFGWPPAVARRLGERGHVVEFSLLNVRPLVEAWCRENGFRFDERNWQHSVPLEIARRFSPDVVWLGTSAAHFGEWTARLKKTARRVVAWIAAPLPRDVRLSDIDCILTSHQNFVERYRSIGMRAERLLPAFEHRVLQYVGGCVRDVAVSFVGSLTTEHADRVEFLGRLARATPLRIWAASPRLLSRSAVRPATWGTKWRAWRLASNAERPVYGVDMYRVMARSRLTINVHIGAAAGLAGNMRMFEATGCGALLLTEHAPNLNELFEVGSEVVPYAGVDDLIASVRRLLEDPDEAARIARLGQKATIERHSSIVRAVELEAILDMVCR